MKRIIQRILMHCSTILFVACLAMPSMAVQDVPLPDSNTQKTEPPVVTPVQAEPVRASNMLLPIEGQVTTAKLIVIKRKQTTPNPSADIPKSPSKNSTTNWATLSQLPSDRQAKVTNVKIRRIAPMPKNASADQQLPSKSEGRLTLLPMIPLNDKPSPPANIRATAVDLEIPLHVLYPTPTSLTAKQDKASNRQLIVLQSKTVRPETSGVGRLKVIKNEAAQAEMVQAEPVQSMTLQPIVLQSRAGQPKKETSGMGRLQVIKNEAAQAEMVQPEPVQSMTLQPIVLQSRAGQPKKETSGMGRLQVIKNEAAQAEMVQPEPVQSMTLQPIVLQSRAEQPKKETSGVGRLQVIKNEAAQAEMVQAEPVQSMTLQPIVLQSRAEQPKKETSGAGRLQVIKNEAAQAEMVQPEPVQSMTLQPIVLQSRTEQPEKELAGSGQLQIIKNEVVQAEPVQAEVVLNEVVQAEPVQVEVVLNEVVQAEPVQAEVVLNEVVQAEPVQVEVVQNEVVQAEPVQVEVVQNEVVQAEMIQPEVVQNEVVQAEMIQPVVVQNEATQAETIRPAIVQPKVVQPSGVQITVADRNPTSLEMKQNNLPESKPQENPQHVQAADAKTAPPNNTVASEPAATVGAVSAAGIPFYPTETENNESPQNPEFPRGKELDEVLSQTIEHGNPMPSRSTRRPGFQDSANLISSSNDSWILNKALQDEQNPTKESVVETDPSIAPQEVGPGTGDYFLDENAAFNNATNGCGNPSCIGCFGGDETAIAKQMDCCGSMLCARRYYIFDALYMTRDNGGVAGSNFFSVSTDSNYGARVTVGRRRDAAEGTEISYWGVRTLTGSQERTDSLNRLRATFTPAGGFTEFTPETFNFYAAGWQAQQMSTEFQSFEYNRTKWAWDVFKSFYGIRYIYFDDDYLLASQRAFLGNTTVGVFTLDSSNNLFGPQIGTEYFYDVGYRVSFSLLTKIGVHVNFSELNTSLKNIDYSAAPPAETFFLDQRADKTKVAGTFELGFQTHYQVAPQSRLRFGYNALWLWGVITAEDNYPVTLTPFTGTDPKTNHSAVLLQGINFGLEFYR